MKGEIAVRYTIRHFDLPLLTYEANMDSADTGLHIIKVYEENRSFLPLNLTVSEDGVERWLRHRTIPKNRAYVDSVQYITRSVSKRVRCENREYSIAVYL